MMMIRSKCNICHYPSLNDGRRLLQHVQYQLFLHKQKNNMISNYYCHHHSHNSLSTFSTKSEGGSTRTTINRKRRNPPMKITKSKKKIIHIKKAMKYNATKHKSKVQSEMIHDTIMKPLSSKVEAIQDKHQIFQNQIVDQMSSIQSKIQNFFLPESLLKNRPSFEEQRKNAVVMDRTWWMWNLALACVPGVIIACICEYYQPEMEQYYEKMNKNMMEKQQRQDGGNDIYSGSMDSGRHSGDNKNNNLNNNDKSLLDIMRGGEKKGIIEKMSDSVKAILYGETMPPQSDDDIKNDSNAPDERTVQNTINKQNDHEKNHIATMTTNEHTHSKDENMTIDDLLTRIKILEKKLGISENGDINNSNQRNDSIITNIANDNYHQQQSEIKPKSNIQKRIEMRKRQMMMDEQNRSDNGDKRQSLISSQLSELKGIVNKSILPLLLGQNGESKLDGDEDSVKKNVHNQNKDKDEEHQDMNPKTLNEMNLVLNTSTDTESVSTRIDDEKPNSFMKWIRNRLGKETTR